MLKLIIFDWDGTLADSVGKIISCKRFLAEKYGLPSPSENIVKSVLGTKFEYALAQCFPGVDQELLADLGREFHSMMQQPEYQATLFPGAREVLQIFKNRGIKLTIATSKAKQEMDKAIIHNNLSSVFDIICCGDEYAGKPNPAMLNYIMKKSNIRSDECVMIGDTTVDILFARNAGIDAVGVTFGAHSIEQLKSANPAALINDWIQLPEVIDRLCYSKQIYCRL